MTDRTLDLRPLEGRPGARLRLQALGANNLWVMGAVLGLLLVAVPLVVAVGLLLTSNVEDRGGWVVLAMVFVGGVCVVVDLWLKTGKADAFAAFAAVNGLSLTRGRLVPDYAGRAFASESALVVQSVRTAEPAFLEVGDRMPSTTPRSRWHQVGPQLFLRVRLAGPAAGPPTELPPVLHDRIERFTEGYSLEVLGDELTLFGERALGVPEADRLVEALDLAGELRRWADQTLVVEPAPPTDPGGSAASPGRGSRMRGPWQAVLWILGLLIVFPLLVAVVMSVADDRLRGNLGGARLVVALLVLVAFGLVGWTARRLTRPR